MTTDAPPAPDVSSWAADLPSRFLECRDLGHNWRPLSAYLAELALSDTERLTVYEQTMRCSRCRTERFRRLGAATGTILGNGYAYPDGYLSPPNTGRLTSSDRDGLRLEALTRTLTSAQHVAGPITKD